jgi:hypothetical protein
MFTQIGFTVYEYRNREYNRGNHSLLLQIGSAIAAALLWPVYMVLLGYNTLQHLHLNQELFKLDQVIKDEELQKEEDYIIIDTDDIVNDLNRIYGVDNFEFRVTDESLSFEFWDESESTVVCHIFYDRELNTISFPNDKWYPKDDYDIYLLDRIMLVILNYVHSDNLEKKKDD